MKNPDFYPPESVINETNDLCNIINNIPIDQNVNKNLPYKQMNKLRYKFNINKLKLVKADKGNILVVLNRDQYRKMIDQHLNNSNLYSKAHSTFTDKVVLEKISNTLRGFQNLFSKSEFSFLTNKEFQSSTFYILPKLHKSKTIIDKIEETNKEYIHCNEDFEIERRPIIS